MVMTNLFPHHSFAEVLYFCCFRTVKFCLILMLLVCDFGLGAFTAIHGHLI